MPQNILEVVPLYSREPSSCRGLFFRGFVNRFWSGDRLESRQGLRLLRRMSCPGCSQCTCLLDEIAEIAPDWGFIIPEIKQDQIYSVRITNISRDWESDLVDDWDLQFYEIRN